MKIKIGTRKSNLAMVQTQMIKDRLLSKFSDIEIEIVPISTKGDRVLDKPLSLIGGKGIFVSEIESALQRGEIDLAIHSAKDLPVKLAENLEISGVLERGNYRDVVVTNSNRQIENSRDFVIGTGSARRRMNMEKLYPNVSFKDIRGNVDTRLRKLKDGEFDGIILAAAGLERLGLIDCPNFNVQQFEFSDFLPAPCQGIIAVESRKNDFVTSYIQKISDQKTMFSFETERRVIELLSADCSVPLGAFTEVNSDHISLSISNDIDVWVSGEAKISNRFELAKELVLKL